jgi:hypothetical protein
VLGPGRYLLGVAEIAALLGFAWLGASRVRSRLLPRPRGAPAHLATSVLALALLIWVAEILGTVSLFKPVPYLLGIAVAGVGIWALDRGACRRGGVSSPSFAPLRRKGRGRAADQAPGSEASGRRMTPHPGATRTGDVSWTTLASLAVAAIAAIHFAGGVRLRLSTGMTGFDSTWYHGPFAAGFFQSGNTIDLHFIAPQFLAWFYPANGEIFHAVGMLAFGRDLLSPLLNLGWFVGCLVAAWCIGRPYRVAPWSLGLGAIALSVPALADQAGEARNDIVGIFFLLAAVAIALNAWATRGEGEGLSTGALVVTGLAAGLAAGTKLNFLLPAAVLVAGLVVIAPRGRRWRALATSGPAALAGGGYWYLRNFVHAGNPLPWIHHLGPISLPAPAQALGGREAHSVLGYLTNGSVWSDWFLPGLHGGLWIVWPLLGAVALAGLLLCLVPGAGPSPGSSPTDDAGREPRTGSRGLDPARGPLSGNVVGGEPRPWWRRLDPVLALAGLAGLATALAWLVAPTSASGPEGMPRGFESGLRYLAPALVLGLALLPAVPLLRGRLTHLTGVRSTFHPHSGGNDDRTGRGSSSGRVIALSLVLIGLAVAAGYPIQRHYLQSRYSDPTFTTPGLDAAFKWGAGVSGARIATTSTRQYPLFGTDLSNRVTYIGTERPHGGFAAPSTCRAWRRELNAGHYDYVVTTRDRLEPGQPPYPPQARWTEGPEAKAILQKPPTVVFQLKGRLNPSACR